MSKTHTRLNKIYQKMKERCYDKNSINYERYGGRGVTICDEWINRELSGHGNCTNGWLSFKEWALTHGYQDDLTIDRIDNDKCYSPDNCRWITNKEQCNNRRSNHLITYKGETRNLMEWYDILGLNFDRVERRLNKCHWTVEKAFETNFVPPAKRRFV